MKNIKCRPALSSLLTLLLACFMLGGCAIDRGIHSLRVNRFAQPREDGVTASVQARALYLKVSSDGEGLTRDSLSAANDLLTAQGPIRRQVLTIVPLTPAGEKVAPRLAKALEDAGAVEAQLGSYVVDAGPDSNEAEELGKQQRGWDLELISEAIVMHAPDCTVAKPDLWTVSPFYAVGTLGCANQVNVAMMASDPRDLIRPRALAPAEGNVTASAVERYQKGEVNELIDIDFSGD